MGYPPQGSGGLNAEQIRKIIEDSTKSTDEKLDALTKKFNEYIEETRKFRNKLESEISKIRESHGEIADRLDELIEDWNTL